MFDRLHQHFNRLADEVERAMIADKSEQRPPNYKQCPNGRRNGPLPARCRNKENPRQPTPRLHAGILRGLHPIFSSPSSPLPPHALELPGGRLLLGRLFNCHELAALFVALGPGHRACELRLQLRALLHRTLPSVVPYWLVGRH
jgi:hypothetical protein